MGAAAADFDNDGWPDIYVARAALRACFIGTDTTGRSRKSLSLPGARSMKMALHCRAWA